MHGWPGEQAPAFEKIVEAFEEEHPDIDVLVEIVGRDRPAILATRLAAGNPPDLTPHSWIGLMKQWADAGQIVDLTGLVGYLGYQPDARGRYQRLPGGADLPACTWWESDADGSDVPAHDCYDETER